MKIGVLALQGAFKEHIEILNKLGVKGVEVRKKEDLKSIQGIILPGGESTAMGKLLVDLDIMSTLKDMIKNGFPVYGTCAGMILLAKSLSNDKKVHLGVMDIVVKRNAYGRQLGSFACKAPVVGVGKDVEMVFIRAPYIKTCGEGIEVLAEIDKNIVAARQENILVSSFHPELTSDYRMHQFFIDHLVKKYS
ncbi:pyridoxal 5'-phosphate synthase glutaminase subunit PdxT [Ilyobacter polytropus]|uniref:Pyridoxal 5'-phosphate synthase subunit PdxT n=1 Tax=Ilyobacter polytropus (strain ATCC 51220 / DSM 2926 / LMG 16218 / CuHBu1) TaxID=572544 RepID=E3H7J0_ILYPC|nr:pyridoxal 5'-phosphate synthase glutaminase subunit PdxT [Ilyobacter polytropus]ADO82886.1 pyridoxal phosphate synthase yaaE subunit [Ilyobacter polytropus DSM 2926]